MRPLLISLLFLSISCSSGDDDVPATDASLEVAPDTSTSDSAVADSEVIDSSTTDSSSDDSMTIDSSSIDSESADTRVDDAAGDACVSMCSASYCPMGKKCCVEHSGPGGTPCAVCVCLGCACTL